jgi:hypothetical protein
MAQVIAFAGFTPMALTTKISIPLMGFSDTTVDTLVRGFLLARITIICSCQNGGGE